MKMQPTNSGCANANFLYTGVMIGEYILESLYARYIPYRDEEDSFCYIHLCDDYLAVDTDTYLPEENERLYALPIADVQSIQYGIPQGADPRPAAPSSNAINVVGAVLGVFSGVTVFSADHDEQDSSAGQKVFEIRLRGGAHAHDTLFFTIHKGKVKRFIKKFQQRKEIWNDKV